VRRIEASGLNAWFGSKQVLLDVNVVAEPKTVTAVIGPSGCGKSTLVRCMNRMHEEVVGARVDGKILFDGQDIYGPDVDPAEVRRRIGMVFQRPNPFPTMSILDNTVAGLKLSGEKLSKADLHERAQHALRSAGLWSEVKDRLGEPGGRLSGGQQQRLCVARALAVEPDVLLLDEPASALDPASTLRIEELVIELKERYTVVIVTHNMQQAARISDQCAFFLAEYNSPGVIIEAGLTTQVFESPADRRTADYVGGRFG